MAEILLEPNREGVRSFLQSEEMRTECLAQARTLQASCGEGYEVDGYTGKNRVNARLWPGTKEAGLDNYLHNTIEKALGRRK